MKKKKYGICPRCNKIIVRKMSIRKQTKIICGNCGFEIPNPLEIFSINKINLKEVYKK